MPEWYDAIVRSLDWIEDNLTGEFTLYDLASHAGYSPFHFSRLFRLITGTTIRKHLADRRLCRAAAEIRDTDGRILDIAVRYGFSSQEALTRAFRAAYGHTPYAFRRNPGLVALPGQPVVSRPEKKQEEREMIMENDHDISKQTSDVTTKKTGVISKFVLINIMSPDPVRLAGFYKDVLGAYIVNHEWYGGPNRIEIWVGGSNEDNNCIAVHYDEDFNPQTTSSKAFMGVEWRFGFEFRVADVDAEYERIRDMDVEIRYPPKDVPWGYRYFGIKDPDGNGIDLVSAK